MRGPCVLVLVALVASTAASAQAVGAVLYSVSLEGPGTAGANVTADGKIAYIAIDINDTSRDGPAGRAPGASGGVFPHSTTITVAKNSPDDNDDWTLYPPSPSLITSYAGQVVRFYVGVRLNPGPTTPQLSVLVTGDTQMAPSGVHVNSSTVFTVFSPGLAGFTVLSGGARLSLHPGQAGQASFSIENFELEPRAFQTTVSYNPCNARVGLPPTIILNRHRADEGLTPVSFTVSAPEDKPYYASEDCSLLLAVFAADAPNQVFRPTIGVTVDGWYLNPNWVAAFVLYVVPLAIVVLLVLWLVRRAKARRDEELLGKPQKPWLIPVEATYLSRLRETDYRAWYVVRHHLMEEEYRSALLWYNSYKAATAGTRAKERLVLRQERAYERWRKAWEPKIGRPLAAADRYEARLQRKLNRKAKKAWRKERSATRALNRANLKAYGKKLGRATEKWERQSRKATKKGRPAPPRPSLAPPSDVPTPPLREILLADHKWAKRAARHRAKAVRKVGDLEVKFERHDMRRLRRVRRKVQKLARKLNDPDFVADHPLLRPLTPVEKV
ncbi:MAG: hypothetical protein ACYDBQ_00510 [Thermoplasmatota archaeon]